jgi:hypothetical protein
MSTSASAQTIEVVNMVPLALSNETNQDSEPDLTVDPTDAQTIIATAFTFNPSGATNTAPVYVSVDGGRTWTLNNIVPSGNGGTGDITVACSANDVLYAGILRGGNNLDMRILRGSPCTGTATMTQLLGRTNEDQPYARVLTPGSGPQRGNDVLFVGHNDLGNTPRSASTENSLSAATAAPPAGLVLTRLERRNPFGQDGPPIRPAIHPNGTVYAAYTQRTASAGTVRTGNIVVVRDDDFGQGPNAFSDLLDPGDGVAGRIVAAGVSWIFNNASVFGQERLGDRATIAVDPRDSQTVYVGWIDRPGGMTGNTATVHVRRSTDGGANWSADLLTINGAISPQLAVNSQGQVGCLYQQLNGTGTGQRWQTHFRLSDNGGTSWGDFLLATTPANAPAATFLPYLGDYVGLAAAGEDFYGVFSASNVPDSTNFPQGVTYQRRANFTTQTLLDAANNPVAASIDPFFFKVLAPKPQLQLPSGVTFARSCVGTQSIATLNVCNTGKADLVVSGIASSNPAFSVSTPSAGYPVTISPDFCFPFEVTFSAASPGPASATLSISSNDPTTPVATVTAEAEVGQPRAVTVIADTGQFGNRCVGPNGFKDLPLTIHNAGSCPLTVSSIVSSSADFETPQVLAFPLEIGAGDSVAVPIRFRPTSPGDKAATISVTTDDPASLVKVVAVAGSAPPAYVCQPPLFAAIDAAIGPTFGTGRTGKYLFDGAGRVLQSFGARRTFGLQAQGEYMFYPERREGQFDGGLLYRRGLLQFGASASFKAATLRAEASTGSLSHATFTLDVLKPAVRFGVFLAKGLRETDVVTRTELVGLPTPLGQPVVQTERLLHTIDQFGGTLQVEVAPATWLDGHLAYLDRHAPGVGDTAGGAVRLSRLFLPGIVGFLQLDVNESFVGANTTGALTFGVTLGRWSRPADYTNPRNPLGTLIPRVRYEIFERVR